MVPISAAVAKCSSPVDVKLSFLFQSGLDFYILRDIHWALVLFIVINMFFFMCLRLWSDIFYVAMVTGVSERLEVTIKHARV